MIQIQKAQRNKRYGRVLINGVSGSGKTWTALTIASDLGKKIVVIDTEKASADLYSDSFDYSVAKCTRFSIDDLEAVLKSCQEFGADVVVIDSLSHFWNGDGGIIEETENRSKSMKWDSFRSWREVGTPLTKKMIRLVLDYPGHIIATTRAKKTYLTSKDENTGKMKIEKGTMEPQIKEGIEFEFDLVMEIGLDHTMTIEKTRCKPLDGKVWRKPKSGEFGELVDWLSGSGGGSPTIAGTPPSDTPAPTTDVLAADEPTPEEIATVAVDIMDRFGIDKESLLIWVPKGMDALTRFARLNRIRRNMEEGTGSMMSCVAGAFPAMEGKISPDDFVSAGFTGAEENRLKEHTALYDAVNLYLGTDGANPIGGYMRESLGSTQAA